MSIAATKTYQQHKEDHDSDMLRLDKMNHDALATRNFQVVSGKAASKKLNDLRGPCIIVSSSGMATGGRVLHHLALALPDPANTVVFAGFQAAGTRGRRLIDGEKETKIHGELIPVNAHIENMMSLSAHADWAETLKWLGGFKEPPKTTFVIHGEPNATISLKQKIEEKLGWHVEIPTYLQTVELE
jgi:metallo-beta-lactamase family protein